VPIGRPIANTSLYVLDGDLRPVSSGETGELYVGGAGVARGYLNRPELTAERFLPDPFSGVSGAVMYKTGDLSRYRADGILEYLGRVDDQVKIRGYRIELGEIEAALAAHPKVRSCTVLAQGDEFGVNQLLAYVVARNHDKPNAAEFRSFLKERLPGYMIPAHFVHLDTLPLTPNGKVDRKALPPWVGVTASIEQGGKARTQTELVVAAIWCDLLKRDTVGVDDDFFDLGGDSMSAIGLLIQIKSKFGVDLDLAGLFDQLKLSSLAEAIDVLALTRLPSDSGDGSAERGALN
jgi:acyl carrier protein